MLVFLRSFKKHVKCCKISAFMDNNPFARLTIPFPIPGLTNAFTFHNIVAAELTHDYLNTYCFLWKRSDSLTCTSFAAFFAGFLFISYALINIDLLFSELNKLFLESLPPQLAAWLDKEVDIYGYSPIDLIQLFMLIQKFFPLVQNPSSPLLIVTIIHGCPFPIPLMCLTLLSEGLITILRCNGYKKQFPLLITNALREISTSPSPVTPDTMTEISSPSRLESQFETCNSTPNDDFDDFFSYYLRTDDVLVPELNVPIPAIKPVARFDSESCLCFVCGKVHPFLDNPSKCVESRRY